MKFIVTEVSTGESFKVTPECANRVKGKCVIDSYIKQIQETGEPMSMYFEHSMGKDYDLEIVNE
jgi:hypothetical protein